MNIDALVIKVINRVSKACAEQFRQSILNIENYELR